MTTVDSRRDDGLTKGDIARLLTLMASWDQRTIGDADVEAWHLAASAGRWTCPAWAARAVVEHYAEHTERVMPAHITRRIRERREAYARSYQHERTPDHVRGIAAEIAWENSQLRTHIDRHMAAWASGDAQ